MKHFLIAVWVCPLFPVVSVKAEVSMLFNSCVNTGDQLNPNYRNYTTDSWDMRGWGVTIGTTALSGPFAPGPSGAHLVPPGDRPSVYFAGCGTARGTPSHMQLKSRIGSCNESALPTEPPQISCSAINTNGSFYNPTQCARDGLGINRGDGFGGFIDSWDHTQIQVALPAGDISLLDGSTVRFDPATSMQGGQFYMMGLAALQEYLYVDMQFMLALGGSLTGAGLVNSNGASLYASPPNSGGETNPYGSFAISFESAHGRLMGDYPKYFPSRSTSVLNTLISTGGSGPTAANSPQQLNSAFFAAMNLWWLFDGLKAAQDLCFRQFLAEAADKSAGLKLLLGGLNIGPNVIDNGTGNTDYATHILPTTHPTVLGAVDITPHMKRFPWGNGAPPSPDYNNHNYITKVFALLNPIVTANSQSMACGGSRVIYDAGITLAQIRALFFGENGTAATQGGGGLLHHFRIDADARTALWGDLQCAFDRLVSAPRPAGIPAGQISYRYEFLTILRVARHHLIGFVSKHADRPTPADAFSSEYSIWVVNHSRNPCTRVVQDTSFPILALEDAPGKGDRVIRSATDNRGIRSLEYTTDIPWRNWIPTTAAFSVPDLAENQRLWFRAADSCGNAVIEEVPWRNGPVVLTPFTSTGDLWVKGGRLGGPWLRAHRPMAVECRNVHGGLVGFAKPAEDGTWILPRGRGPLLVTLRMADGRAIRWSPRGKQ